MASLRRRHVLAAAVAGPVAVAWFWYVGPGWFALSLVMVAFLWLLTREDLT